MYAFWRDDCGSYVKIHSLGVRIKVLEFYLFSDPFQIRTDAFCW